MTALRPTLLQNAIQVGISNPPGNSRQHGEEHWKAVAAMGVYLAKHHPERERIDFGFIATFAMLHDTMRRNDHGDPGHGIRAAQLYRSLGGEDERMGFCLENHNAGEYGVTSDHVETQICWDADRLCLVRFGYEADDHYLSTAVAKSRDAKRYAQRLHQPSRGRLTASWQSVLRYPGAEALWA